MLVLRVRCRRYRLILSKIIKTKQKFLAERFLFPDSSDAIGFFFFFFFFKKQDLSLSDYYTRAVTFLLTRIHKVTPEINNKTQF